MDNTEAEQAIRKAGRPRSTQSHQAILEATLTLFSEEGLAGLTIEAIAERARVGKTTIYRRWSSKEDLLKDALVLFREGSVIHSSGNIRNDLLTIATEAQHLFSHNQLAAKLIAKLIAEIKTNPEIYRSFHEKLIEPRLQQFREMLEQAQKRGELRADLDVNLIVYLIFSSLIYNNFFSDLVRPDGQQICEPEELVDTLLRGIGT